MKTCLSKEQRSDAIVSLQRYFSEELEYDLKDISAGFLLDYFLQEIGPFAYNKGVEDAKGYFVSKTEDLTGLCFEEALTFWKGGSTKSRLVRRKP